MARRRIKGDIGFRKLLRRLPDAARQEMGDVLDGAGADLALAMKADAPVKTGALRGAITWKLLRSSLRLRVGLIGKRVNRDLFYGRIIEFGRKAQTVTVRRLARGGFDKHLARIRAGSARASIKPSDLVTTYKLQVKGRAPRPFVFKKRGALRDRINRNIKNYWNDVLARAAEGVSFDD